MYPLIPYQHFVINTSLASEEIARLVLDNISPPRSLSQPPAPGKEFEGSVSRDGFTINRIIRGRDSFLPVLNGRFTSIPKGTKVDLYLTPHPIVIVFLLIVCFPLFEMLIVALKDFVLNGDINVPSLSPLGIFAGCLYLIGLVSFGRESKKAVEFAKRILRK